MKGGPFYYKVVAKDSSNFIKVLVAVHSNYNNSFTVSPLEITIDDFPCISTERNSKMKCCQRFFHLCNIYKVFISKKFELMVEKSNPATGAGWHKNCIVAQLQNLPFENN